MSDLKNKYNSEVKLKLKQKFNYPNVNMIPKIEKVVVNCTTKDIVANGKVIESVLSDLTAITGQKPFVTKAKKSVASFKLREGQAIGAAVTLRGEKMFDFLEKLMFVALPRVRDFRGISERAFDGRGNYTLGLKEQILFPEIEYDKIDKARGLSISIVTTANTNEEGRELLSLLGMPFRKQ